MAIPFAMPNSEDDARPIDPHLEQLMCDLENIKQQIEILLRVHRFNNTQTTTTTMMTSNNHYHHHHRVTASQSSISPRVCVSPRHSSAAPVLPDLISNLPPTASLPAVHPAATATTTTTTHSRRQRFAAAATTDLLCCDQAKYIVLMDDAHGDDEEAALELRPIGSNDSWIQHTNLTPTANIDDAEDIKMSSSRSSPDPTSGGLLAKIMPTKPSLWTTAVICAVGCWHIFRAR